MFDDDGDADLPLARNGAEWDAFLAAQLGVKRKRLETMRAEKRARASEGTAQLSQSPSERTCAILSCGALEASGTPSARMADHLFQRVVLADGRAASACRWISRRRF